MAVYEPVHILPSDPKWHELFAISYFLSKIIMQVRLRRTWWLLVHSKVTLIRRFWLDEISHYLYVRWSNRNRIHVILFIDFVRKGKWNHVNMSFNQTISNFTIMSDAGDGLVEVKQRFANSRRLGLTFEETLFCSISPVIVGSLISTRLSLNIEVLYVSLENIYRKLHSRLPWILTNLQLFLSALGLVPYRAVPLLLSRRYFVYLRGIIKLCATAGKL
jgi:hypothetical protein